MFLQGLVVGYHMASKQGIFENRADDTMRPIPCGFRSRTGRPVEYVIGWRRTRRKDFIGQALENTLRLFFIYGGVTSFPFEKERGDIVSFL